MAALIETNRKSKQVTKLLINKTIIDHGKKIKIRSMQIWSSKQLKMKWNQKLKSKILTFLDTPWTLVGVSIDRGRTIIMHGHYCSWVDCYVIKYIYHVDFLNFSLLLVQSHKAISLLSTAAILGFYIFAQNSNFIPFSDKHSNMENVSILDSGSDLN